MMSERFTGELVAWKSAYGFLRPDDGGRAGDIYVNLSAVEKSACTILPMAIASHGPLPMERLSQARN